MHIINSQNCKKKYVQMPDFFVIDHFNNNKSIEGGSSDINNLNKESNAQSMRYLIFDSTGLSINDIKKIYQDKIINSPWY